MTRPDPSPDVLRWRDTHRDSVHELLAGHGLAVIDSPAGAPIPGSFWGDDEAGLIGDRLYARPDIPGSYWGAPEAGLQNTQVFVRRDTPLHSVLHEACHWICMDGARRAALHTNAGGDYDEENAVCYLQILLADRIRGYSADACMADMDAWGYSFRLGSARAWFEHDADDAREWLERRGILARLAG
ncbi:MAG: hypothetical protein ACPGJE_00630 [Wenzhouxiangellaceae bacterium]